MYSGMYLKVDRPPLTFADCTYFVHVHSVAATMLSIIALCSGIEPVYRELEVYKIR